MSPTDARHGTYAGAVAHWFDGERPCDDCARAEWRYRKLRKLRALNGDHATVPAIGTLRRYHALMALGWTGPQIAAESGLSINTLRAIDYHASRTIHATTAAQLAAVYERLCMTRPEGHYANRARNMARQRGYLPPLAFDDIDDPDERPTRTRANFRDDPELDEAAIWRRMHGDKSVRLTKADAAEVVDRCLAAGWAWDLIEKRAGLKADRYRERRAG